MTPQERERIYHQAHVDYMAGRISLAELDRIRDKYGPDYAAMARGLALALRRDSRHRRWTRWLR